VLLTPAAPSCGGGALGAVEQFDSLREKMISPAMSDSDVQGVDEPGEVVIASNIV